MQRSSSGGWRNSGGKIKRERITCGTCGSERYPCKCVTAPAHPFEPEDAAPADQPREYDCDCPCDVCAIVTGKHCGNPPCDVPAVAQVGAEQALKWLDEVFGLNEGPTGLPRVKTVSSAESGGTFALGKDGKRWRYSEMLTAYAAHVTKGLEARLAESERDLAIERNLSARLAKKEVEQAIRAEAAEARNLELMGALEWHRGTCVALLDAFKEYAESMGGLHEDDCPMDDTCDCKYKPFNVKVNTAINVTEDGLKRWETK